MLTKKINSYQPVIMFPANKAENQAKEMFKVSRFYTKYSNKFQ